MTPAPDPVADDWQRLADELVALGEAWPENDSPPVVAGGGQACLAYPGASRSARS